MRTYLTAKILLITLFLFLCMPAHAIEEETNYFKIYNNLPDIKVEFIHNEDPDEYYDYQKFHFSPYPLIRTSSDLYVKNLKIKPSYYLLTPREYKGKHAVLFKQKGKVKFVVPVYEKETIDPKAVYKEPPKPKTPWWKWSYKWIPWVVKKVLRLDKYKNHPAMPKSLIEAYDLYGPFYEIDLYYEDNLYKMIFRKNLY